ncbi:hypothetical protein SSS_00289 [Sarcoptes scabiei]|uniref:Uncharacterized protein n=1 Tax=Sarcoptes scabiei TaxID=52283 RepID=A0A834R3W3_SARSC|nr:hypothetical protein SSS_00289 [Sarcoptes scabiei]
MNGLIEQCPYGTSIFFIPFVCATAIQIVSIVNLANIFSKFSYDLLKNNYYWIKDLNIILITFSLYCLILGCYDLIVSFRSYTLTSRIASISKRKHHIYCLDSYVIKKIAFVINHLTVCLYFLLTLLIAIKMFVVWIVTKLCLDGSKFMLSMPQNPFNQNQEPGELGQFLDFRQFAPILKLRVNETQLLYFENDRLKMFCDDYVSIFHLYSIFLFITTLIILYSLPILH